VQQIKQLGRVISVRGSQASIGLPSAPSQGAEETRATVGKFLGIRAGKSLLTGLITDVSLRADQAAPGAGDVAVAQLELIGEICNHKTASPHFQRGVTTYPAIGDAAIFMGPRELRLIFHSRSSRTIEIGHLQQDPAIAARLDIDEMLSKHFAVLGTTGSVNRARSRFTFNKSWRHARICGSLCSTYTTNMAGVSQIRPKCSIRIT
jgi:uncharacterized protein